MLALSELLCYTAIAVVFGRKYRRNVRKIRDWAKKWLLKRQDFSHVNLLKELRFHPKDWHNFLRMNESTYLTLLSVVSLLIQEENTTLWQAITPHERLYSIKTINELSFGLEDTTHTAVQRELRS